MEKSPKNRKWLFFTTGLLLGLFIGISIFFVDKHIFSEKLQVYKTFDNLNFTKTEVEDTVKVIVHDTIIKRVIVDTTAVVASFSEQDDETWEDPEFSIEPEKAEEVVVLDRILNNKKITVKVKQTQEIQQITPPISIFEVQQWSTPIKNSMTYQDSAGILKIKGMDINSIEIFFVQGNYYLYDGIHYYTIKENKSYEKLIAAELP